MSFIELAALMCAVWSMGYHHGQATIYEDGGKHDSVLYIPDPYRSGVYYYAFLEDLELDEEEIAVLRK